MDSAQSHVGLASSAFGHDPRSFGPAQILRGSGDSERLSGESFPEKRRNVRRNRVFRALQWRIGFKDAFGEQRPKLT
jgi:hypothetical protein